MKKTKLFTSIAALALVLGLGACELTSEEETTPEESETTTETTDTSESTPTTPSEDPDGYVLVGDFIDSNWDSKVDTSSKYYIPLGSTEYKQTVTIAAEPDYGEWEPWDAGLRVVEWGDSWNLVVGSDDLAEGSAEGLYGDVSKNIKVSWGETYDITVTFGDTNSILVTLKEEEEVTTTPAPEVGEYFLGFDVNGTTYYIDGTTQKAGNYRGEVTSEIGYAVPVTLATAEGENAYYLTFELDSTTYYVCIIDTGSHINLQYSTTATPIYWDEINAVWVNEEDTYFLCYNSTYKCAYTSDFDSWWGSSPVGELIEIPAGWEPLEPEETLPQGAISTTITYETIMGLDQFSGTDWKVGGSTQVCFSSTNGVLTSFDGFGITWYTDASGSNNGCAIYGGSSLRIYKYAHFDIAATEGYEIYSTEVYTSSNGSDLTCTNGLNTVWANYTYTTDGPADTTAPIVYTNGYSSNKNPVIGYITVIVVPAA